MGSVKLQGVEMVLLKADFKGIFMQHMMIRIKCTQVRRRREGFFSFAMRDFFFADMRKITFCFITLSTWLIIDLNS